MVIPLEQHQDQYGFTMLELVTPRAGSFDTKDII